MITPNDINTQNHQTHMNVQNMKTTAARTGRQTSFKMMCGSKLPNHPWKKKTKHNA